MISFKHSNETYSDRVLVTYGMRIIAREYTTHCVTQFYTTHFKHGIAKAPEEPVIRMYSDSKQVSQANKKILL